MSQKTNFAFVIVEHIALVSLMINDRAFLQISFGLKGDKIPEMFTPTKEAWK